MTTGLFYLIQFVWGFPQNFLGALLSLFLHLTSSPRKRFGRTFVVFWPFQSSLSLGVFLFVQRVKEPRVEDALLCHEAGHTIQSLYLGPLYLLVIGLPSLLWAGCFSSYRRRKKVSYYAFYPERWANALINQHSHLILQNHQ